MSVYHWPSWCRTHHRPHIRRHGHCATNWDWRRIRRFIDSDQARAQTPRIWRRP